MKKEIYNVETTFKILHNSLSMPIGYEKVTKYLVYNMKIDFTRNSQWHKTHMREDLMHVGIVSRVSIRIAFAYTILNGLDAFVANNRNAYLQVLTLEKYYIIYNLEFRLENAGKRAIIRRVLYSSKATGREF